MKAIFIKKTAITGKDKREWLKADFVLSNGEVGSVFASKEDYAKLNIPDVVFPNAKQLSEIIDILPANIEFGLRGRVSSVTLLK